MFTYVYSCVFILFIIIIIMFFLLVARTIPLRIHSISEVLLCCLEGILQAFISAYNTYMHCSMVFPCPLCPEKLAVTPSFSKVPGLAFTSPGVVIIFHSGTHF